MNAMEIGGIVKLLKKKHDDDVIAEDGFEFLTPRDYCTWLAALHY